MVKHWQIFMFKCKGVKMLFLLSKRTNQIARKKTTKKTQTNCEGATLRELQQRCTSRFVFGSETEKKNKKQKNIKLKDASKQKGYVCWFAICRSGSLNVMLINGPKRKIREFVLWPILNCCVIFQRYAYIIKHI